MRRSKIRAEFDAWEEMYFLGKKGQRRIKNADLLADLLESDAPFFMTPRLRRDLAEIMRDYSKLLGQDRDTETEWVCWYHNQNLRNGSKVGESKLKLAKFYNYSFDKIDKTIQRKYADVKKFNEKRREDVYDSLQATFPK